MGGKKYCDLVGCRKCCTMSLSATVNSTTSSTSMSAYMASIHDLMVMFGWNGFTVTLPAGADTSATYTATTFAVEKPYKMQNDLTGYRSTFAYSDAGTTRTGYLSFTSSGYAVFTFPTATSGGSLQLYAGSASWIAD